MLGKFTERQISPQRKRSDCLCSFQLGIPCGGAASPGAGQAGEDRLPCAVHDRRGADTGVVSPQGGGVNDPNVIFLFLYSKASMTY